MRPLRSSVDRRAADESARIADVCAPPGSCHPAARWYLPRGRLHGGGRAVRAPERLGDDLGCMEVFGQAARDVHSEWAAGHFLAGAVRCMRFPFIHMNTAGSRIMTRRAICTRRVTTHARAIPSGGNANNSHACSLRTVQTFHPSLPKATL